RVSLEEGQSDGPDHVGRRHGASPELRVGCVDAAALEPQSHVIAEEQADAGAAMDAAVREVVRVRIPEVEQRVTAQDVERETVPIHDVENETAAANHGLELRGRRDVVRRLEERLDLEADRGAEREREPHAAPDLILEAEA